MACPHCQGVVALPAMGGVDPAQPPHPQTGSTQQPFSSSPTVPGSPSFPPDGPQTTRPSTPQVGGGAPVSPAGQQQPTGTAGGERPLRPVPIDPQRPQGQERPISGPSGQRPVAPVGQTPGPTGAPKTTAGPLPMSTPKPVPKGASPGDAARSPGGGAASGGTTTPGRTPVPISSTSGATVAARRPSGEGGSLVIPTEDGGFVTLRDPVKTVGDGDEMIELQSLPPEEREKRKLKKNLIIWGVGFVVIGVTLYILLAMGPL